MEKILVYGNSSHNDLVAIVVINKEYLTNSNDNNTLKIEILNNFHEICIRNELKSWEIPKAVYIETETWTPQNGFLTGLILLFDILIFFDYVI